MKSGAGKRTLLLAVAMLLITAATRMNADTGTCGGASITLPFTDVLSGNVFFCSIAEAYFSGLTNGTTATTYDPSANVPREQMAAFVTRTMDQSVKRTSKRAMFDQFWTSQGTGSLGITTLFSETELVKSDGADLWVTHFAGAVSRVRASDGRFLETWTGAGAAYGVLIAMGKVFAAGVTNPGQLYEIDPTLPAGPVTIVTSSLGENPNDLAFDGQHLWTANYGPTGSVSIVTLNPLSVTTTTTGFVHPVSIVYDGTNIWVTDSGDDTIKKLDSSGNIMMAVPLRSHPSVPAFDGTNIWVPTSDSLTHTLTVVRAQGALSGSVLAILFGNGLNAPVQAAFDGERILVTNAGGDSVSLWRASDLTPAGTFPTGPSTFPNGACSDGLNFWITLEPNKLARF